MSPHNMRLRSSNRNRKVFLLTLLWGCFALIWAYFALLAPAFGADTTVNGRSFTFEPPAGHCLLNEQEPKDRAAIDGLQQIQKPEGDIIWMFADCHELAQLHAGQTGQLKHFGLVMVVQPNGVYQPAATMTRFEFTQNLGRNIPVLDISRVARTAQGRVAAPNAPNLRLLHFGLATIDAAAAYAGLLVENNWGRARSLTAGVMVLTVIQDMPVAVALYGPYGELADYRQLRNALRPIVGAFILRNDTGSGTSRNTSIESDSWGLWLRELSLIDWSGAMLAGLLSLGFATVILVALRHFRS